MMFSTIIEKLEASLLQRMPFVAFRKPNDKFVTAFFQNDDQLIFLENFSQLGFVLAPFDNNESAVLFPLDDCEVSQAEIPKDLNFEMKNNNLSKFNISEKEREKHIELVQNGINFIESGSAVKIVLSRKEEINIEGIHISKVFQRLVSNYPLAFTYVWYHPKVGLWLGATPETLINVNNNKFQTMALAGTQVYTETINVHWGEKEKEEQQIVANFIYSQIKDMNPEIGDTFTKRAGNLLHICTKITGELTSKIRLEHLINKLHPTPAICGLPKEKAKDFIMENENYNREFYSGFLGEINIANNTNLYVNLRCIQIKNQKAILYIGGGITRDSNPENEWKETVAKSEVMKKVIN